MTRPNDVDFAPYVRAKFICDGAQTKQTARRKRGDFRAGLIVRPHSEE